MPYIKAESRDPLTPTSKRPAKTPGELNFQITCLVNDYLHQYDTSYGTINDVVGALEGAKLEFYRRVAAPYEDSKIEENGDVYP